VTGAGAEIHERIAAEISRLADTLIELSLDLHAHPELALKEKYAASRLTGLLREDFTVSCIGTPGEEGAGGKVVLLEAGVFDGVDAALMFHPGDTTMPIRHATATRRLEVEFHGVAAHAAASAHEGRSAVAPPVPERPRHAGAGAAR
jgi:metal-dependent amidase/aminoacylase/carboxypeptidase family protein